jgi:hypothetical protein
MNQNSVQSFPASVSQTLSTGQVVTFDSTKGSVKAATGATANIGVVIGDYKTDSTTTNTAVAVQLFSSGGTAMIAIKTKGTLAVGSPVIVADGAGFVAGAAAFDKGSAILLEAPAASLDVVRAVFV